MRVKSGIACITASVLAAQAPQPPIIRLTTRLVEVNVIVRSKDGPVTGLTRDDFSLFDKGRQQKIAVFSVNSIHELKKPAAPLPPNVFTNRPEQRTDTPTSITVVLLDAINTTIQDQLYAKRQFIKFLGQIRPEDRVAVYALGTRLRVLNDFTNDSKRLVAAVNKYSGQILSRTRDSEPDPTSTGFTSDDLFGRDLDTVLNEVNAVIADLAIVDRVNTTVAAMEAIAQHVGHFPGRKNLIWVTGSFPFSIGQRDAEMNTNWNDALNSDTVNSTARPKGNSSIRASSGGDDSGYGVYGAEIRDKPNRDVYAGFDRQIRRATQALNNAGIAVYPVDARGVASAPKALTAQAGPMSSRASQAKPVAIAIEPIGFHTMEHTAENTGGRAFYNTNDIQTAIRTALDDSEVTYTLGFYADSQRLDSKFHDLKVRVSRKDVDVRYRKGYFAYPEPLANDEQRAGDLRDALWSPLDAVGLDIAARIERVAEPKPGSLRITISLDPSNIAFQKNEADRTDVLDIVVAQQSADGRDLGKTQQKIDLKLDQARFDALNERGLVVSKTIAPARDVAQIRIVLLDCNSGNLGSLTIPAQP
jgi:VWFA-related protein